MSKTSHWQQDKDHFIHPYTDFSTFAQEGSQVISKASGMHVTDNQGNQFVDAIAGLWCVNIGHGRTEIADAAAEQIRKMDYYNPFGHSTNEPASELAAKLAQLSPGSLNHVFYGCGGSVANDTAVRLVHHYFNQKGQPRKKKIISRLDGYHGSTYLAATLTGIQGTKIEFDTLENGLVHHVSAANMYRRPEGMSEADYCDHLVNEFEQRILQLNPDHVAAFIAEPIMGAGGVLVAPEGYHKRMYEVCKKYDMLYIADEVVTAFGRLGHMVASKDIFDVEPDILCIAKGLTSGYQPLGATLISDEIYNVIARPQVQGGLLSHGFTYSGHPVAAAVALKNIEILESENLCEHVRSIGPYFFEQAKKLLKHDIVGDVRGSHLMVGIELVKDKTTKENYDITLGLTHKVFEKARELGVIVRPVGHLIVLSPPLIIDEVITNQIFSALDSAIADVQSSL
jgi:adenosylmethionine-8-amino-7-oxononanoate aminotransferase